MLGERGILGGVVPGNAGQLKALSEAGVFGFKCFLVPSGVAEFEGVAEADLRSALPVLAAIDLPLLVHAELPGPIEAANKKLERADRTAYKTWLQSRPPEAETQAIELMIRLAEEFKALVHIVHVSSERSVPLLQRAREAGLRVSAETCPHYLFFASSAIPKGRTEYKCAPPIRDARNREKLWDALGNGALDFVVSDHSPSPPALKCVRSGDFFKAWGGIASLQLGLPAMWTKMLAKNYSLEHLARWMCGGPAQLAGLEKQKGAIAPGCDADLVIWNPEKRFTVQPQKLQHRHKLTPYARQTLQGVVEATFLAGELIYDRGRFRGKPSGKLLRRGRH